MIDRPLKFFRHRPNWCAALLTAALLAPPAFAAEGAHGTAPSKLQRAELGTSAAFGRDGKLFTVGKEGDHVVLRWSLDEGHTWSTPVRVNASPEAISADGEGRPKIALAGDGSLLVTWTKPLAKPYSGEIRLARSNDDGGSFAPPITVHHDRSEITHRFDSLAVGRDGRVTVAWIDKRDQEAAKAAKAPYRGAAVYAAVSDDGGRTFHPEAKVADHSCECCRTALAHDADGAPLIFWRHVFAPNERDHALARLKPDGTPESVRRATFERWKIDACPHHGPSLIVDDQGTKHAVWFNQKDGEGHVFYGRLRLRDGHAASAGPSERDEANSPFEVEGPRIVGGPRAANADLAAAGPRLAIAWKEFDGERTRLHALVSNDRGRTFATRELGATAGASDQPRVLARGEALYVFWRTEKEGFRLHPLP